MSKAFGHIRGTRSTERHTPVGHSSEVVQVHVPRKVHHGVSSRLYSVAAAAVAVRSLPQQQTPSSNPAAAAAAWSDEVPQIVPDEGEPLTFAAEKQQVQQLQISGAEPPLQQERLQQLDASSQSVHPSSRPSAAVLGSRPGVVWHVRRYGSSRSSTSGSSSTANGYWRTKSSSSSSSSSSSRQMDWNAQYAAAAILDAFGSMDLTSSNGSSSGSTPSVQSSTEEPDTTEQQQHQPQRQQPQPQWQQLQLQQQEVEQGQESLAQQQQLEASIDPQPDVDYMLLDRLSSHASASISGRQHSSSGWLSNEPSTSTSSSSNSDTSEQAGSFSHQIQLGSFEAAAAAVSVEELLYMQQSPAANFRDPRFEMAISRWIKEAPDWFKVRTVYERFGWRFNIVNLSCIVAKLATLLEPFSAKRLLPQEQSALQQFLKSVLSAVGEMMPSVDAGTAAALLLGYSRLLASRQVGKNPQLIAALLEHVRPHLCSLQPCQLAGCLWALKALDHQPPDDWLDELYRQTEGTVSQLRGDELAVLLRGLAGVQARTPSSSWLSAVLTRAEEQFEGMEPKHMSLMLMGLAYMEVRPSRSWMDAVMSAMRSKFDQMGPQALSNILWALAKMGCLPDRSWLNSYFNTTMLLLNSMTPLELSVNMWSVNKLKLEPSDEWLDEYFDESEAKLSGFNLRDLALCGYSLAKLGLRPPQTWLRRYCTLLLRLKGGLWKNKKLLTQVLVALDSFKLPRMDMWRRELYSAAGYKLYKYPNWRQRVKVMPSPSGPYSMWPYSSSKRRFGRRGSRLSRSSSGLGARVSQQGLGVSSSTTTSPPVSLRSGDWGIMDGMGGGRGVMGSVLSSYEELGVVSTAVEPTVSSSAARDEASAAGSSVWGSGEESSSNSSTLKATGAAAPVDKSAIGPRPPSAAASGGRMRAPGAERSMLTGKGWSSSRSGVVPPRRPLSTAALVRPPPPAPAAAEAGAAAGEALSTVVKPAAPSAADDADVVQQAAASNARQQQQETTGGSKSDGRQGSSPNASGDP